MDDLISINYLFPVTFLLQVVIFIASVVAHVAKASATANVRAVISWTQAMLIGIDVEVTLYALEMSCLYFLFGLIFSCDFCHI